MTSLQVKGSFEVISNDQQRIQIGVNHNGVPSYRSVASPTHTIIKQRNAGGTVVSEDQSGVPPAIEALCLANDAIYERRRIAWVKLTFIPKYTSYIQSIGDGSGGQLVSSVPNEIVYVVHDANGLNGLATGTNETPVQLLANNTGVKLKKLNRSFKVFRRSRKFGFAPKFIASNGDTGVNQSADINPSGAWRNSTDNDAASSVDHTWIMTEDLLFSTAVPLYTCVFEIKYVWADRTTAVSST